MIKFIELPSNAHIVIKPRYWACHSGQHKSWKTKTRNCVTFYKPLSARTHLPNLGDFANLFPFIHFFVRVS